MLKQIKVLRQNSRFRKQQRAAETIYQDWLSNNKPLPTPHIVKQKTIKAYRDTYKIFTLVETGTYLGDMVAAQLNNFSRIISIELSKDLYERACIRFRKNSNVQLLQGDSGKVLHQLIDTLKEPAFFWLDGHYSAGLTARGEKICPIYEELDAIFKHDIGHVILIDDAADFKGEHDYPTVAELEAYIKTKKPAYHLSIEDNIIRITK